MRSASHPASRGERGGFSIVSSIGRSVSTRRRWQGITIAFAVVALLVPTAVLAAKPPNTPPGSVDVQLLAINDFHGNLQPPSGSSGRVGSAASDAACTAAAPACVLAGGVEYLATHIKTLEATNP